MYYKLFRVVGSLLGTLFFFIVLPFLDSIDWEADEKNLCKLIMLLILGILALGLFVYGLIGS